MTTLPRRIVAVGGGGFLMDDASLVQERYLVSQCRRPLRLRRECEAALAPVVLRPLRTDAPP